MVSPASSSLPAPAEIPVDEQSIRCVRCGYDLRGTDLHGRCPECGLKAYWSLRAPEQLSQYPAGWVRSMAWGVRLLAVAYGLIALVVLVNASRVIRMGGIFMMSDFIAAGALQVIGAWALARKSNHRSEPRTRIVRFLLRVSSFGMLIAWLGQLAPFTPLAHRIINIAMILGYLTPAMALFRLRAVARMIADSRLAERCTLVGYGALVTVLLYGALTAWGMTRRLFTPTLFVIEQIIDFALLFFMILAAIVLAHCVIDFGRAAKLANRAWRADAPNGTSG